MSTRSTDHARRGRRLLPTLLGLGLAGCGDPEPGTGTDTSSGDQTSSNPTSDSEGGSSSGSTSGASTQAMDDSSGTGATDTTGGGPVIPDFNGCTPADYEDHSGDADDRTIAIAATGLTFTPKCMIVAAGQTVRWEGSLSAHPLAPGNPDDAAAGSPNNPVVETSSGTTVEFVFPDAGTFPYYCKLHSFGAGEGMAGVVHVLAAE